MKKIFCLLLTLLLSVTLFACGGNNGSVKGGMTAGFVLSEEEQALVGEWSDAGGNNGFVLLSSGNALTDTPTMKEASDHTYTVRTGTWEVENGYLIIYEEGYYESYRYADVYKIIDNTMVEQGDMQYYKS